jgi:tetratricopeptide (TPR) repeat protein
MQQARLRVRFLGLALLDRGESSQQALEQLVRYGGEWGIALAKQVCKASVLPVELKVAAVDALVKLGVQPPDQPGEIVHDGKPVQIEIKRMELIMREDPELGRLTEKAMRLRGAGWREEAKEILESMLMDGQAYPRAMLALANLYRSEGDLDRAQSLLEILDRAFPDYPIVQFNLAGFWLQKGDPGRALSHFRRVDRAALPAKVQPNCDVLAAHLREHSSYGAYPATVRKRARRKCRE